MALETFDNAFHQCGETPRESLAIWDGTCNVTLVMVGHPGLYWLSNHTLLDPELEAGPWTGETGAGSHPFFCTWIYELKYFKWMINSPAITVST